MNAQADLLTANIAKCAEDGFASFHKCLQEASKILNPREQALLEDQLGRYSLWNSRSVTLISMRRMNQQPPPVNDVNLTVCGTLEVLKSRIRECTVLIRTWEATSLTDFKRCLEEINRDVTLLDSLLNILHRADMYYPVSCVVEPFDLEHPDNWNRELVVRRSLEEKLQGEFPRMKAPIRRRLAASMTARSKRISLAYRQNKEASNIKTPVRSTQTPNITCRRCSQQITESDAVNDDLCFKHAQNDLYPYICLFEDCAIQGNTYKRMEDWLDHMSTHKLSWQCRVQNHPPIWFQSRQDYIDHMRSDHRHSRLSEKRIQLLADRAVHVAGYVINACPFCRSEARKPLHTHVARHLQDFALKSLFILDDEVARGTDKEERCYISGTHFPIAASDSGKKKDITGTDDTVAFQSSDKATVQSSSYTDLIKLQAELDKLLRVLEGESVVFHQRLIQQSADLADYAMCMALEAYEIDTTSLSAFTEELENEADFHKNRVAFTAYSEPPSMAVEDGWIHQAAEDVRLQAITLRQSLLDDKYNQFAELENDRKFQIEHQEQMLRSKVGLEIERQRLNNQRRRAERARERDMDEHGLRTESRAEQQRLQHDENMRFAEQERHAQFARTRGLDKVRHGKLHAS